MEQRLIDANALKKAVNDFYDENFVGCVSQSLIMYAQAVDNSIDNAPTVESEDNAIQYTKGYQDGFLEGKKLAERPQGEREFIEILTNYPPDDLCTYPEYRGKPYYSIHYRENGEEFVGYGTYKIEVLSEYLREYFFK